MSVDYTQSSECPDCPQGFTFGHPDDGEEEDERIIGMSEVYIKSHNRRGQMCGVMAIPEQAVINGQMTVNIVAHAVVGVGEDEYIIVPIGQTVLLDAELAKLNLIELGDRFPWSPPSRQIIEVPMSQVPSDLRI